MPASSRHEQRIEGTAIRSGRGPDAAIKAAIAEMDKKAKKEHFTVKFGPNLIDEPEQVKPGVWKVTVRANYHK